MTAPMMPFEQLTAPLLARTPMGRFADARRDRARGAVPREPGSRATSPARRSPSTAASRSPADSSASAPGHERHHHRVGILDQLDVEAERVPRVEVAEAQAAEPAAHHASGSRSARRARRRRRCRRRGSRGGAAPGPFDARNSDVQALAAHRLQQLDLHVAAAREARSPTRTTTGSPRKSYSRSVARQVHELAAARASRASPARAGSRSATTNACWNRPPPIRERRPPICTAAILSRAAPDVSPSWRAARDRSRGRSSPPL